MVPGARERLYKDGVQRAKLFCKANDLVFPELRRVPKDAWQFGGTCAYYRPTYIAICVERCATPGYGGRAWSWPGYVVDRTPYGVIQHELGHHVDITFSKMDHGYQGSYSRELRKFTGEDPVTTYCPNDAEWFAEIFRLFVTNADLLHKMRPRTYTALRTKLHPVHVKEWFIELEDAPERTINAAKNKIGQAGR